MNRFGWIGKSACFLPANRRFMETAGIEPAIRFGWHVNANSLQNGGFS